MMDWEPEAAAGVRARWRRLKSEFMFIGVCMAALAVATVAGVFVAQLASAAVGYLFMASASEFRCPRCEARFYARAAWRTFFTTRCLNCGLAWGSVPQPKSGPGCGQAREP